MNWIGLTLQRILTENAGDDAWGELLTAVGFAEPTAAIERLKRIIAEPDALQCLPSVLHCLSENVRPDQALISFERLVQSVADRGELLRFLADHQRTVEILMRLFVGSQFLTEIVLGNPAYVDRLTRHQRLAELKSVQQLEAEAHAALETCQTFEERLDALRRFQRWELLRIGVCDFFGLLDLRRVTVQLSLLADALVRASLTLATEEEESKSEGFAVIAMGKLGGEELNYSSDIDLVFVAQSNSQGWWRPAQRLIRCLTEATGIGFLYRVDMRLRPWGNSGELVTQLEAYVEYLATNAEPWEKQALLKARVIAGDFNVGKHFLQQAEPLIYNVAAGVARQSVRGAKAKIEGELNKRGRLFGEVKLGEGSIRDIEFVAQYLQLIHGQEHRGVRSFNTLDALVRLTDHGLLHADEFRILSDGYVFLRTVEHSLQLMHNKQTHELPKNPDEMGTLGRRLDFDSGEALLAHFRRNCTAIRGVYERYLGTRDKAGETSVPALRPLVQQHIARMESAYVEKFSDEEIAQHAALADRLSETEPILVDARELPNGDYRVTVVGFDFQGELTQICGLMLCYGFNIVKGQVFTYERPVPSAPPALESVTNRPGASRKAARRGVSRPAPATAAAAGKGPESRRKIVDVFTVRSTVGAVSPSVWQSYQADMTAFYQQVTQSRGTEAQGAIVKRVAERLRQFDPSTPRTLYPVDIQFDNDLSEQYTVLHIAARDTLGFLYELTNALATSGIYIGRVFIASEGDFIQDSLFITDTNGHKITDRERQRQLQAALVLIKHFTHLLPRSPNPESALLHFREFISQLFIKPDWMDQIATLERSEVLDALARLLGVSDFLWNDFLRMQHENLFPVVQDVDSLAKSKTRSALADELAALLADDPAANAASRRAILNAFKDREMFRADMRHILGHSPVLGVFSHEMTSVAEVVVEAATRLVQGELVAQHGQPRGTAGARSPLAVCALGKCGGREMGFASDIELMFIYEDDGRTDGPMEISTAEFYVKVVDGVTKAIRAKQEGIFEIDLRLRPYGNGGSLAVSLESFQTYFHPDGPAWPYERQALVKLRPIAGNAALVERIFKLRQEFVFSGRPFDSVSMRAMRERQIRQLVTPGTFNAKLSPGGLVDVEYLIQGLQMTHGHLSPELQTTNTSEALQALADQGILFERDYERLKGAYDFLRRLITSLRIVRGNARDLTTPRPSTEEFSFLARRLGYENDIERLRQDIGEHAEGVREILNRLMG